MKRILALLLLVFPLAMLSAQQKYALVIGNGAYAHISRLNNPANDASDMKAALQGLGFTVDAVINGNRVQMQEAVERLKNRLSLSRNSYGFFFYAGHGVQSGGANYLIPVDADIPSESYLPDRSVSLHAMLGDLNQAGNELNIVVLDACRDNPFSWKRGGSRGLNVVGNQPADSIVVYATGAGSTAVDGEGRNGLFTSQLLKNLKTPGLEVNEIFRRTGGDVARISGGSQRPAVYTQFYSTAYLAGNAERPDTPPVPAGFVRIEGGAFTMGSPASEVNRGSDETQRQVTVSGFYLGKYEVTVGDFKRFVNATGYKTQAEISGGGNVRTGGEWVQKGDANWKNPYFNQNDNEPVVLVSWYDAIEYCNWMSKNEGLTPAYTVNGTNVTWNRNANGYRLPTEAEWEYACRGGTTTPFGTGNNITAGQANYDGSRPYKNNAKGTFREKTWAVGSGTANPWGLYDMHGNVWEWCWDRYGPYNSGARTDPAGPTSGTGRVSRGGGWGDGAQGLRSANRYYFTPSHRVSDLGVRLLRP
jgi:formylglycine-generating enzyme required for sulfatase activity